ncbi:MAG: hypothetical protein H7338_24510 [Candidatus Sericytochromatia bacterium]|nr:hypothetical protein [Candidatus Sericytochromatia bacterium]
MSQNPKRLRQNVPYHDEFVLSVATQYKKDGYKVHADIDGWEKPEAINGFVPDVHAFPSKSMQEDDKVELIVEVETCDTCDDETQTKSQFQAFARYARENEAQFEVGVPTSCLGRAQRSANTWGIKVGDWWAFPN